jgi:hypothetical protein
MNPEKKSESLAIDDVSWPLGAGFIVFTKRLVSSRDVARGIAVRERHSKKVGLRKALENSRFAVRFAAARAARVTSGTAVAFIPSVERRSQSTETTEATTPERKVAEGKGVT